jgi:AcrR family transcriptional regulator
VSTTTRRGRPPQISRDDVVGAALAIGLDRFTMTSVAERLGVTTPALYTHVSSRDELLTLVSSELVQRIEGDLDADGDWRAFLTSLARAVRNAMTWSHWAVMSSFEGPSTAGLAIGERGLGILTDAGFAPSDAARAIWLVLRLALTAGPSTSPSVEHMRRAAPELADPPAELPFIRQAVAELGQGPDADPFEWDLAVLLDGLAGRLPETPRRRARKR